MRIIVRYVFVDGAGVVGLITFLRNWQSELLPVVEKSLRLASTLKLVSLAIATRGRVNKKKQGVAPSVSNDCISNLCVSLSKAIRFNPTDTYLEDRISTFYN
jgi:hypothetical protein